MYDSSCSPPLSLIPARSACLSASPQMLVNGLEAGVCLRVCVFLFFLPVYLFPIILIILFLHSFLHLHFNLVFSYLLHIVFPFSPFLPLSFPPLNFSFLLMTPFLHPHIFSLHSLYFLPHLPNFLSLLSCFFSPFL